MVEFSCLVQANSLCRKNRKSSRNEEFVKKKGKTGPSMQLFAGFTDDKPVVIGLSKNKTGLISLFVNINRPGWFISIYYPCKSFQ